MGTESGPSIFRPQGAGETDILLPSETHMLTAVVVPILLLLAAAGPKVENWPQFRGPESLGVAEDHPDLPDTWSATENVVWKSDIPGVGWSSPVVWGDRVFLTSVLSAEPKEPPKKGLYFGGNRGVPTDDHRWMVYCLDWKTGKILWEREVHRGVPKIARHLKNSYASETPVTDGERVYAYFGAAGGLFAFNMEGKLLWSQRWGPFATRYGWGSAASPVLHEGRLYLVNDNDQQSFLVALDKKTGQQIWRVEREEKSNWATPYIWKNARRTEIVTPGTGKTRSYDLDGKLLWELGGMSSIVIPTPFSQFGLLYLSSGYVGDQVRPVFAVRPGASGDITPQEGTASESIAWRLPQGGPYNPSPVVYGDYYYTLLDRGFFTSHDARTGREIYGRQRIDPAAAAFTASPWAYKGQIFALSEEGDAFRIQAGPEFKVLGKNSLDDLCMATPAIARGSLLIRTASRLYRLSRRR